MTATRKSLLAAAILVAAAIPLSAIRPLWLDEIMQLLETRQTSVAHMMGELPRNIGASPLGYVVQQAWFRVAGYSLVSSRLPAALFADASVFLVGLLAAELGIARWWHASVIFAIFPLTLRYATESRVYSQALFFSVLATYLYLKMERTPTWRIAGFYWLALTAAAYTQPYAASVSLAHALWPIGRRRKRAALLVCVCLLCALLAYLPWFLWSKDRWIADIAGTGVHFRFTARTPRMLFREFAGAGYWGSGVLTLLCLIAVVRRSPSVRAAALLVLLCVTTVACVLTGDALFHYFLAARQFLWALPAAAILATAAIERHQRAGLVLAICLAFISTRQSFVFFHSPSENWQAAADSLAMQVHQGARLIIVPSDQAYLYEFFHPELSRAPAMSATIVMALTLSVTAAQRSAAIAAIPSDYAWEQEEVIGGSHILRFRKKWR